MKIFIKQHLGLGDNIVNNGMIRKLHEEYPFAKIFVPCKYHNLNNVTFMFRDIENINVVGVNNDYEMFNIGDKTNFDLVIDSFLMNSNSFSYSKDFDNAFYLMVGMNPDIKQKYFHIQRDEKKENEVYNELITKNGYTDYIFLHEKPGQVEINRNLINSNLPIVFALPEYSMFDLLKVMEMAKECHLISSSFLSLMMCKKYNNNVFAHMYSDRKELSDYVEKNNIQVIL